MGKHKKQSCPDFFSWHVFTPQNTWLFPKSFVFAAPVCSPVCYTETQLGIFSAAGRRDKKQRQGGGGGGCEDEWIRWRAVIRSAGCARIIIIITCTLDSTCRCCMSSPPCCASPAYCPQSRSCQTASRTGAGSSLGLQRATKHQDESTKTSKR